MAVKVASVVLIVMCVGHLVLSILGSVDTWAGILRDGVVWTVPAPWTADDLERQKLLWRITGSFAVPTVVLGAWILRSARRGETVPACVGPVLLVFGVANVALAQTGGGFWLAIVAGALLVVSRRPSAPSA